jgi:hypothetical protein
MPHDTVGPPNRGSDGDSAVSTPDNYPISGALAADDQHGRENDKQYPPAEGHEMPRGRRYGMP